MLIFEIFNYLKSVILGIFYDYKTILMYVAVIGISFLLSVMLKGLYDMCVCHLGGREKIFSLELVKKTDYDNPVLTVKSIFKKIHIAMILCTIFIAAMFFFLISIIFTVILIVGILFSPATSNGQNFNNILLHDSLKVIHILLLNTGKNFTGILLEVFLIIFFISYTTCYSNFDINLSCDYEIDTSVAVLWVVFVLLSIIFFIDILCTIISGHSISYLLEPAMTANII